MLGVVRQGDGGRLVAAWQQVATGLNAASALLDARRVRKPLCYPDMITPQADIFRNVVLGNFIGEIQPMVARMNRRFYSIYQRIESLERVLSSAEPPAYREWRLQRDEQMSVFRQAVPAHVTALEPLMKQCGFLPG